MSKEITIVCDPRTNEEHNPLNFLVIKMNESVIEKIKRGQKACEEFSLASCRINFEGSAVCGEIDLFTPDPDYFEKNLDPEKFEETEDFESYNPKAMMLNVWKTDFVLSFMVEYMNQYFESPTFELDQIEALFKQEEVLFQFCSEDEVFTTLTRGE